MCALYYNSHEIYVQCCVILRHFECMVMVIAVNQNLVLDLSWLYIQKSILKLVVWLIFVCMLVSYDLKVVSCQVLVKSSIYSYKNDWYYFISIHYQIICLATSHKANRQQMYSIIAQYKVTHSYGLIKFHRASYIVLCPICCELSSRTCYGEVEHNDSLKSKEHKRTAFPGDIQRLQCTYTSSPQAYKLQRETVSTKFLSIHSSTMHIKDWSCLHAKIQIYHSHQLCNYNGIPF